MGELGKIAEFYKALGDETRLTILQMLKGQEMCVCEILARLEMTQSAVSHHLKILKQAGLVTDKREGKWIYYSLNPAVIETVFQGEDQDVAQSYAEPLKQQLTPPETQPSRKDSAVCEALAAAKRKKVEGDC